MKDFSSRERILTSLEHREPDSIPFDLGGMAQSGMHRIAYARLRRYLGLPEVNIELMNLITQVARLHEDFRERLRIDTYLVYGQWANPKTVCPQEENGYMVYTDEWVIGRRMPRESGLYFDIYRHPFDTDELRKQLESYEWPNPQEPARFTGLCEEAKQAREKGKFVVLMGLCPGITEMYSWLRGFERFYTDLASEPETVQFFLAKMTELKIAYWRHALNEFGECIDAVNEADDLAGQTGLLLSPETYRRLIKPYHKALIAAIKQNAPHVKVIFHSCGAIRPLISDFIDIGVDILNPVQINAQDMDPFELKREFGEYISFWGGGVDTQQVLQKGNPESIRDHVRRNIEALSPGGGFVFSPVHVIQANVPPENFMVMWETLKGKM